MDSSSWLGLGVLLLCLVLLAFISTGEASLTSIGRSGIKNLKEKGIAGAIERLLRRPTLFLSALLIAKNIAIVVFASLATTMALRLFIPMWWVVLATMAVSFFLIVFLQFVFKSLALRNPERAALLVAGSVNTLALLLKPLVKLFELAAGLVVRLTGAGKASLVSEGEIEELRRLVDMGEGKDTLEETERQMIRGIIELEETTAREIMVPRIDIVAVDVDTPIYEVVDLIIEHGYSRIPLYERTIDNIIGIIYAKDLLHAVRDNNQLASIKEMARPVYFVPESKKVDELLHEFQQNKVHMAIVVDEYGGTAGLVTIEDVLEEIVGEVVDEYDIEEPRIERISEDEAIIDARVSIDDLNEMFGLSLEAEGFDTVGGFVFTHLGKVPVVGDEIEANGFKMSVLSTSGRRIRKVKVTRSEAGDRDLT